MKFIAKIEFGKVETTLNEGKWGAYEASALRVDVRDTGQYPIVTFHGYDTKNKVRLGSIDIPVSALPKLISALQQVADEI